MYPSHNTRGGTPINGTGYGQRMAMTNQMSNQMSSQMSSQMSNQMSNHQMSNQMGQMVPGMNAYGRNMATPMPYQHGGMQMMMPMGNNYKWPMIMSQYGSSMMPQMYSNQTQMPMYNTNQQTPSVAPPAPPTPTPQTSTGTMKLPTIVCPVEEESRRSVQPKPPSTARRPSNPSSTYDRNHGRTSAGPSTVSSCNSSLSSVKYYLPLQQALSVIRANNHKKYTLTLSPPRSNQVVRVNNPSVVSTTAHANSNSSFQVSNNNNNKDPPAFNPVISNITSLSPKPLKVVDVRSVAENTSDPTDGNAKKSPVTKVVISSPTKAASVKSPTRYIIVSKAGLSPAKIANLGSNFKCPRQTNASSSTMLEASGVDYGAKSPVNKSAVLYVVSSSGSRCESSESACFSNETAQPVANDPEPVSNDTEPVSNDTEPLSNDTEPLSNDTTHPLSPSATHTESSSDSTDCATFTSNTDASTSEGPSVVSTTVSKTASTVSHSPAKKSHSGGRVLSPKVASRRRSSTPGWSKKIGQSIDYDELLDGMDSSQFLRTCCRKPFKFQYRSDMILTAMSNVDIPLFLSKIQGPGRRVYARLKKQLPDVFVEMSKDFIFLEEEARYSCIKCYFVSPRVEKVLEHELAHYGSMICKICNKAFIKKCDEDRHKEAHKFGRIKCRTPRFLPEGLKDMMEETPRVLEIAPIMESQGSSVQPSSSDRQVPLRNITNIEQSSGATVEASVPDDQFVISEVRGMYHGDSPRTEVHDNSNVIVISPCASPRRIKTEPVDDYWTTSGNSNVNNNQAGLTALSLPNAPVWSNGSSGQACAPMLLSQSTGVQDAYASQTHQTQRLGNRYKQILPRPPPSIPPPPPLMPAQPQRSVQPTSVQPTFVPRSGLSFEPSISNYLQNVILTQTASQVIPITLSVPNLLPDPVTVASRIPAGDQVVTTSAVVTATSSRRSSADPNPAAVIRNPSTETEVVESSPLISEILSSGSCTTTSSPSVCTTSALSTTCTTVSSSEISTVSSTVQPPPATATGTVQSVPATASDTPIPNQTPASTSAPSTPVNDDPVLPNLAAALESTAPESTAPELTAASTDSATTSQMPTSLAMDTPTQLAVLGLRKRTPNKPIDEKLFLACQLCSYTAKTPGALDKHYNAHSKNQVCRFCNKAFLKSGRVKACEQKHMSAGDALPAAPERRGQLSLREVTAAALRNCSSGTPATPGAVADPSIPLDLSSQPTTGQTDPTAVLNQLTQPGISENEPPTSEGQPSTTVGDTTSSVGQSAASGDSSTSADKQPNWSNVPFRIDNFTNAVLTDTSLFQCDVKENNEIVISLTPCVITDMSTDLIKECPPVASLTDISEIMEGVKKASEPVNVKVQEVIMPPPAASKKRKSESESGSAKKKRKKATDGAYVLKKKKKKKKNKAGSTEGIGLVSLTEAAALPQLSEPMDDTPMDNTPNVELPGNYVADPVHYDSQLSEDGFVSPTKSLENVRATASITPEKDGSPAKSNDGQKDGSPVKANSGQTPCTPTKANITETAGLGNAVTQIMSPGKYKCTSCTFTTDTKMKMKAHQKAHEMNLHMCEFCHKTFFKMTDLVRHVDTVHKQVDARKSVDDATPETSFMCDCCDYQTDLYARFKSHQNLHRTGQNICQWCGKAFFTIDHLVRHWFTHNMKDNFNRYTCNLCQYKVTEKQQMISHMAAHYKEKPEFNTTKESPPSNANTSGKGKRGMIKDGTFNCSECSATYPLPSLLAWHRRKVHNIVSLSTYKCQSCDVSYTSQWKLKKHVAEFHKLVEPEVAVDPERTHACATCNRKFASAAYLNRHMKAHSGEKPFHCIGCGKKFAFHQSLSNHLRKCRRPKIAAKKFNGSKNSIKLGDVLKMESSNPVCVKDTSSDPPTPDDDGDVLKLDTSDAVFVDANGADHITEMDDDDDDDVIFLDVDATVPEK